MDPSFLLAKEIKMSVVICPVSFRLITTLSVYFSQLASLRKQEKSNKRHEITKHRVTLCHISLILRKVWQVITHEDRTRKRGYKVTPLLCFNYKCSSGYSRVVWQSRDN